MGPFTAPGAPSAGLPDPAAPGTIVVRPGDALPNASALDPMRWPTVIFAPGVHRVASPPNGWTVLTLAANTRYFLCAGAVVHAALAGPGSATNVRLDGFGVLSGHLYINSDSSNQWLCGQLYRRNCFRCGHPYGNNHSGN